MLEEEMREIDECDMEEFGTFSTQNSSEKTVDIQGDRWCGHRRRHRKGIRSAKKSM